MAKKTSKGNLIGAWAFLIGVILAVLVGLFANVITGVWVWWVLVIAGILIGLFNIASSEAKTFMNAAAILVLVSFLGQAALNVIAQVGTILAALLVLFVPATIVVALKVVFAVAKK